MKAKFLAAAMVIVLLLIPSCTQYILGELPDPGIGGGETEERLTPDQLAAKLGIEEIVRLATTGESNPASGMTVSTAPSTSALPAEAPAAYRYVNFSGYSNGEVSLHGDITIAYYTAVDSTALESFAIIEASNLNVYYSSDAEPYTVSASEPVTGTIEGTLAGDTFRDVKNITLDISSTIVVDNKTVNASGVTGTGTETSPLVISTASQFFSFARAYNNGEFETPVSVELGADIDLEEREWVPIGTSVRSGSALKEESNPFIGVFDGNGYTISGFSIGDGITEEDEGIGLFSAISGDGTVVKNVRVQGTIENDANGAAGFIGGIIEKGAAVEKCTVLSGSSIRAKEAGGIAGRMLMSGSIIGSENNASVTGAGGKAAGIVSSAYYDQNKNDVEDFIYETFKIEGCTNNGVIDGRGSGYIGGIAGLAGGGVEIINCTNNATGTVQGGGPGVGGIAGQLIHGASLSGCYNHAAVNNTAGSTGGLVGWIRYYDNANYNNYLVCSVSDSHNDGDVTSSGDDAYATGGAIGMIYWAGNIEGSSSKGTVTCGTNNMVGGFCGGVQYLSTGDTDDSTGEPVTSTPDANYSEARKNGITFTDCHSDDAVVTNTEGVVGTFIGHNVNCGIDGYEDIVTTITGCTPTGEGSGIK